MQTPWVAPPGNGVAMGELGEGYRKDAACFPHETQQTPLPAKQPFLFFFPSQPSVLFLCRVAS